MKRRANDLIPVDAAQPLRRLRRAELPLGTISLARYLIGKILVREDINVEPVGELSKPKPIRPAMRAVTPFMVSPRAIELSISSAVMPMSISSTAPPTCAT
jgi:hypothetical protein